MATLTGIWAQRTDARLSRSARARPAGRAAAPPRSRAARWPCTPAWAAAAGPRASRRAENEVTQTRSQAAVRLSTLGQRPHRGLILHVDVEPGSGPRAEQVLQQRDRLGAADPRGADLAVGQVGDPPGPVGDPVERPVVERHQDAVRGRVHVGLQVGVAEPDRVLEGGPGVLRVVGGAAAVREREGARQVEEVTHSTQYADPGRCGAGQARCHSRRRASARAIAAAAATFSEPTRPSCGM